MHCNEITLYHYQGNDRKGMFELSFKCFVIRNSGVTSNDQNVNMFYLSIYSILQKFDGYAA